MHAQLKEIIRTVQIVRLFNIQLPKTTNDTHQKHVQLLTIPKNKF
jgi:hypothetical protein